MRLTVEQNLRRMKWKQPYLQRRKGRWRRKKTEFGNCADEYFISQSDYYSGANIIHCPGMDTVPQRNGIKLILH